VVLVGEAAEAVAATDLADGWCRRWLRGLWRLELERTMRPVRVLVRDEDPQDALEVAAVDDQQPVKTFGANGSDEALGDGVCLRRPHRRLDDPDPPLPNTSSKVPPYLPSRSRIRNRMPSSARSRPRLRACWMTHAPVGLLEQPANDTRRLACAMKNKT
jgi:hypothetical protein